MDNSAVPEKSKTKKQMAGMMNVWANPCQTLTD